VSSGTVGTPLCGGPDRRHHRGMRSTSVVLADDHPIYREGLAAAIHERPELSLVAECDDGDAAVEAVRKHHPDVALLDVRMRRLDGVDALTRLGGARSRTRVVFLSAFGEGEVVARALAAGAAGFLSKESEREDICDALLAAADGQIVLSPRLQTEVIRELRRPSPDPVHLGEREQDVMRLTARGHSAPEIAAELGIAPSTVKTHLKRVYGKLGVADRAAMVAEAMRCGLLS
jgi:two-component system, NarL family, nitrate/nitrite response regulator NarL